MRTHVTCCVFVVAVVATVGCGEAPLDATFTSRVRQLDSCRITGDRDESCKAEEVSIIQRVHLVESAGDDGSVWLYGLTRGGNADRAIVGVRDDDDAFLFTETVRNENSDSECTLTVRLQLSLRVDPEAAADDACRALIGRENESTTSTEGCDNVNDPPLESTLLAHRRWEAIDADDCKALEP